MKTPFFSSTSVFVNEHNINMALNILLRSLDQLFRLCPFLSACPLPAFLLAWGAGVRKEKASVLCKHRAEKSKTLPTNTVLDTSPKHNNVWVAMSKVNFIPARASTTCYRRCSTTYSAKLETGLAIRQSNLCPCVTYVL